MLDVKEAGSPADSRSVLKLQWLYWKFLVVFIEVDQPPAGTQLFCRGSGLGGFMVFRRQEVIQLLNDGGSD